MESELNSRVDQIRAIIELRRRRSRILGYGLFSDPAWDMLLELFAARLRRRATSLADILPGMPQSSRARWVAVLQERGLITAHSDALIPTVLWLELSETAASEIEDLLEILPQLQASG